MKMFYLDSAMIIVVVIGILAARKALKRRRRLRENQLAAELRKRLEREYLEHDREFGQNLACLIIQLRLARRLRSIKPDQSAAALDQATSLALLCLNDLRSQVSVRQARAE